MIDHTWTLFLDRDGIINERIIGEYVKNYAQFVLKKDFIQAMPLLNKLFARTIIVTNQQGIEKKLVTAEEVENIHLQLCENLKKMNIIIDKVYYCPHLEEKNCPCRKPAIGMALKAKHDFPTIDFHKSVMIGDSLSDLLFGKKLKMKTVFIPEKNYIISDDILENADFICENLVEFANLLK